MAATEFVLTVPPLDIGPTPGGGRRFAASVEGRSFHGTLRSVPGRMVYDRRADGIWAPTSRVPVNSEAEFEDKLADLLLWVATGKMP